MPTIDERLKHVALKVKRAKEHIADVDAQLRAFYSTEPYKVGATIQPETRRPVYYVTRAHPTPESVPLVAGDAIQNLMSALDYLAYQIICSDTADNPPNPNWIYFPIADDAMKYESKKAGKMRGAAKDSFDVIDGLKPYRGGNSLLWMLYKLNNVEKHRLLLTVGSQAAGVHIGQMVSPYLAGVFPAEAIALIQNMDTFIVPADKGFPLKEGLELYIGAVGEKPNPKQQFRFQVALNERGIAEGEPLLETLHQLTTLVEGIVAALTPRLRDTTP